MTMWEILGFWAIALAVVIAIGDRVLSYMDEYTREEDDEPWNHS